MYEKDLSKFIILIINLYRMATLNLSCNQFHVASLEFCHVPMSLSEVQQCVLNYLPFVISINRYTVFVHTQVFKLNFIFACALAQSRVMGQRVANTKSNENRIKYRIYDARFNGAIFSMTHGISAVLFDSKV